MVGIVFTRKLLKLWTRNTGKYCQLFSFTISTWRRDWRLSLTIRDISYSQRWRWVGSIAAPSSSYLSILWRFNSNFSLRLVESQTIDKVDGIFQLFTVNPTFHLLEGEISWIVLKPPGCFLSWCPPGPALMLLMLNRWTWYKAGALPSPTSVVAGWSSLVQPGSEWSKMLRVLVGLHSTLYTILGLHLYISTSILHNHWHCTSNFCHCTSNNLGLELIPGLRGSWLMFCISRLQFSCCVSSSLSEKLRTTGGPIETDRAADGQWDRTDRVSSWGTESPGTVPGTGEEQRSTLAVKERSACLMLNSALSDKKR